MASNKPDTDIKVKINGKIGYVDINLYVGAKTKQLREFGYNDLKESEVMEQIRAIQQHLELGKGLTVIGMMMKDEVLEVTDTN
jgi:hypothetical protein